MQTTRLIVEVQHPGSFTSQDVAEVVRGSLAGRLQAPAWTVTVDTLPSGAAPEPGPGWHITTCGWCGGEAQHEDNCKNDT